MSVQSRETQYTCPLGLPQQVKKHFRAERSHPVFDILFLSSLCRHLNAYSDANLTTWEQAGYSFPRQRLVDDCQ